MPDVLLPFSHAVAAVLAAGHHVLAAVGMDSSSGLTWVLAIFALVLVVRIALVPVTVHSVRLSHASASARPALDALRKRYAGRTDLESLRAMREEQAQIQAEHGISRAGCLPLFLQMPILFALYGVLSKVAEGQPVGLMDAALATSAGSASILGVRLADRLGSWGAGVDPEHLVVVILLAGLSASMGYVTQRWFVLPNLATEHLPEAVARAQQMMPLLTALSMLPAAAMVPLGLLVYWVASGAFTLVQQLVVTRCFPTPGTAAAAAKVARLAAA
ncbi:membrane protein insertase YidC [Austwickia chelonae]|uniref:membrane protein insertase YidC n=1 Tax=Austwickia chelonae TaxID=100225 RepID=UPI000E269D27|nr:membrane protein insertase YidC [Austwickia chelonae]